MFKINHCKIFGHKLYTTMTLKKKHDGTRKGKTIIIATTKCKCCRKIIKTQRVWTTKPVKDVSTGIMYYK